MGTKQHVYKVRLSYAIERSEYLVVATSFDAAVELALQRDRAAAGDHEEAKAAVAALSVKIVGSPDMLIT